MATNIVFEPEMVRIFLVDDHPLFRQGLRRVLEAENNMTVVGEAGDGREAIRQAVTLRPDIIFMDISIPHANGIEAGRKIKLLLPEVHIILLTMHENLFLQKEGIRMGASGFLLKRCVDREVFEAIRTVQSGRPCFFFPQETAYYPAKSSASSETLSPREGEILRLLANGTSNEEIAAYLCISIRTVETHRKNLMKKLSLHSLSDIIRYALIHGMIRP